MVGGVCTIKYWNILSKYQLMSSAKQPSLNHWDPLIFFWKTDTQSWSSYDKENVTMIFCTDVIKKNWTDKQIQKCTWITWISRKQKNWTMEYCILHALIWGLNIITTSKMYRRSIQLGSNNIVYLFSLSVKNWVHIKWQS